MRLKVSGVFFELGPQYSYLMSISTDRTQTANGSVVGTAGSGTSNLDNVNRNNDFKNARNSVFQAYVGVLPGGK